jgi:predicted ribosomally synthesized peptide with SipW-like signal peptide
MKKIIKSGFIVLAVAAIAGIATYSYFSDTETSTGNTFTAGSIDLKVDSTQHYNNAVCVAGFWQLEPSATLQPGQYPVIGTACGGTWGQPDGKDIVGEKFFDFADVKPGDSGENTVSLHVVNNDAYICGYVTNLTNNDNLLTEPESAVDTTDGVGNGELQDNILMTVWRDNGNNPNDPTNPDVCDNIQQEDEFVYVSGVPIDSNTGGWLLGHIAGDKTVCLGVKWEVPTTVGNDVQTDSVTGDISFYTEQYRNNPNFVCPAPAPAVCNYSVDSTGTPYVGQYGETITPVTITNTDCNTVTALRVDSAQSFGSGGWAGWSCIEAGYPNAVGGGVVGGGVAAAQGLAEPSAPAVGGFNYPVYPHYTFPGVEEGWVVQAGSPVPTGIYVLCAN